MNSFFSFMTLFPHDHPEYTEDTCVCTGKTKGRRLRKIGKKTEASNI
jgi:hypothetical protein